MRKVIPFVLVMLLFCTGSYAQVSMDPDECVHVRVVDCGAALCCVVTMPDDHYMIYDGGHWQNDCAIETVRELIPAGSTIDLMVISHSDADHLGAIDEICDEYDVDCVLRTGYERSTASWRNANEAIVNETDCTDYNLTKMDEDPSLPQLDFGDTWSFGDVDVTFVCGWSECPQDWRSELTSSEERNAISIVTRLEYKGHSILFTGDTVGRGIGDSFTKCIAAEKYMIDNSCDVCIDSDVLVGQHHGGDNASSYDFICAVSPMYVVYSAGHMHDHPTEGCFDRCSTYLTNVAGRDCCSYFRTDWGDDEHGYEAEYGSGYGDTTADDDVDIWLFDDPAHDPQVCWLRNDIDPHLRP